MKPAELFGIISGVLGVIMVIPYIKSILGEKTKPQRASWFIWTLLTLIAFLSQLFKGANASLGLAGGQFIGNLLIFCFALKYGVGGFSKRDVFAVIMAIIGIILWFFTKEPAYALIIVILVNSIGTVLTTIKAYQDPSSETILTWIIALASGVSGLLAAQSSSILLVIYPVYIIAANLLVIMAMIIGKRSK